MRPATIAFLIVLAGNARPASAQTDYYNTDSGRPVTIEDAYPVERHAFELQLAPVRLERAVGGVYGWQFEPELAYGIMPRTQLEVGLPIHLTDPASPGAARGVGGLEISALHNLNVETATLPALGVAIETVLPLGPAAPEDAYASIKAIATRTFGWARIHLNGRWTWGPAPASRVDRSDEMSRWMVGGAIDRTLPLRSALFTAAVFVEQPLRPQDELQWTTEAGLRYQWSPRLALDGGVGKGVSGEDRAWSVTMGAAYAFAIRSLMPGR